MRAAVVEKVGAPFVILDIEIAEPIGREVLVDVKASGLCHSDLHVQENDFGYPWPGLLGHEAAGIVSAIGPEVTEFSVGDHVVVCLEGYCGHCLACVEGRPYQCENEHELRRTADQPPRLSRDGEQVHAFMDLGAFAEQVLVHENNVVRVRDDIPFSRAALLSCGVVTGAGAAINSAQVRVGDSVAVIGCGGVGLNTIQGARIAGARFIIAIDLQPEKLELAKRLGATHVINPAETEDVPAAVREITGASGVDHSFEVIGLKATAEQAVRILGVGGTAYLVGMQRTGTVLDIKVMEELLPFQKGIKAVTMGSTTFRKDIPMFADLYVQGRLDLDSLVSKEITLEEITEGYAELKTGKVARSVIVFE